MATVEVVGALRSVSHPPQLDLSPEQRRQVLSAAGELICAFAAGLPAQLPDPTLSGAADQPVSGAFISIKRGQHLRGCCGGLQDQPIPLGQAIFQAARRAVEEDPRFPRLSPTELKHLRMEVWLLVNPVPVTARGEDRLRAVIVGGKHGLVVRRGQNRGLLLPGVAAEHQWDAQTFLEHTCMKAGLHPSLWKDDATAILTFEAVVLRGPVVGPEALDGRAEQAPLFRPEELATYATFCRDNIRALLTGATPMYYLSEATDANVSGVLLTVRRAGRRGSLKLSRLSLRPGVPLQATLFQLSQAAARTLAAKGASSVEAASSCPGLTILWDPAMHGTVADPHLDGIDVRHRAVLVTERSKVGLVYHPEGKPEELVRAGAEQAQVTSPASASIYSLETVTTEKRVVHSTAPRPIAGRTVRQAAVAGKFYPDDPSYLSQMLDDLLAGEGKTGSWPAALIPHAGLRFSGHIAAAVLKRIEFPPTVIILGPKHTALGMEWAVAPHQTWSLPGSWIASDPGLARQLVRAIPGLALDALAHRQEHAIEVELPFIARLAPEAKVVGIAIGQGDWASCRRFANGLAEVLEGRDDQPLLLISSDMNHFATDAENRRLDELALTALEHMDPAELYETVRQNHISMCGVLPAVIVLQTLHLLERLNKAERVAYGTSADVTGDTSRVVGYAGMLFGV